MQCRDGDLDYVEEEKEEVEEREAEELEVEDNPNRSESSEVSCLDSDSEETNQYSSTRDNFSESEMCIRDRHNSAGFRAPP